MTNDEALASSLPCACATLRRASRAVTQMYEEELRKTGLRVTQFTLLQALQTAGAMTQRELGELLCIDSTTLTRSLRPLIDSGWLKSERGEDRRERHLRLTASGRSKVQEASVSWRRAQGRVKKVLGSGWPVLEGSLRRIAGANR